MFAIGYILCHLILRRFKVNMKAKIWFVRGCHVKKSMNV